MAAGTTRRRRPHGGVSRSLFALIALLCCAALAPSIAAAAEPGGIAGTVTHASVPVAGVEVCVAGPEEPPCTTTGVTGEYSFGGLEAGTYRVVFGRTGYVTRTLEGIVVAESETATANAALEETGIFDGNVFDSNTLVGLAGAEACATQEGGGPGQGCATTDGSGEFEVELPPGHYEVTFSHPGYLTQSFGEVEITEGGGSDTDVDLEENGAIEGTVTDSGGDPIPDSLVCVNGTNGAYFNSCAFTDAEGEYAFGEIPPYEYEVEFTGQVCDSGSGCEVEECVMGETCTRPYVPVIYEEGVILNNSEATIVQVAPGETVEGIDEELVAGGKIEGTVTLAGLADAPLAGIEVSAGPESINARSESATTNAAGEYTIEGLAEGAFLVRFWKSAPKNLRGHLRHAVVRGQGRRIGSDPGRRQRRDAPDRDRRGDGGSLADDSGVHLEPGARRRHDGRLDPQLLAGDVVEQPDQHRLRLAARRRRDRRPDRRHLRGDERRPGQLADLRR